MSHLLTDRTAIIYGAGGGLGSGVARTFAREGARVFLAGRSRESLEAVAADIGDAADVAVLDVLDEHAVDEHAARVAAQAGGIDISFNLISHGDVQGTPMAEMAADDYLRPVVTAVRTNFLTWRAATRHMTRQGSGVILVFGGSGPPMRDYYLGGLQVAFEALESMRRQLSAELGPQGVRVVTLRTGGVPETIPEGFEGREAIVGDMEGQTMLGRPATFEDVGNVAAFVASDRARTMTAATVNISAGALID
jgi:3-oxoacyl-[acyl-carrier protein] reductase